jgi:hypothetical protein
MTNWPAMTNWSAMTNWPAMTNWSLAGQRQHFSPPMEDTSLTSTQEVKEIQVMKDLLDQLQDLQKAVTQKPKFKISSAKRQLKDLLCEGSMAIKSTERNKYWRKEISRITNHNELLEFLKDITTNFNKKFAYELSKKLQE